MFKNRATLAIAGAAAFMLLGSAANAQIVGSKHDLGAATANTTEVCVFCHTPHGSNTSAEAPLWNKNVPTSTYDRYTVTSTLDGDNAPVGSVSIACLSCHDGTAAVDAVLNAPGAGMNSGQIDAAVFGANMSEYLNNTVGAGTYTPVPVLGTDLRNDHPVSIQYAGGGLVAGGTVGLQSTFNDSGFNPAYYDSINGFDAWWVDTAVGTAGQREKTDMILYTRNDAINGSGEVEPFVECASCHDPHNSSTEIVGEQVSFLRVSNQNSDLCLTCHDK